MRKRGVLIILVMLIVNVMLANSEEYATHTILPTNKIIPASGSTITIDNTIGMTLLGLITIQLDLILQISILCDIL